MRAFARQSNECSRKAIDPGYRARSVKDVGRIGLKLLHVSKMLWEGDMVKVIEDWEELSVA